MQWSIFKIRYVFESNWTTCWHNAHSLSFIQMGFSPLHLACELGLFNVVQYLTDKGSNENIQNEVRIDFILLWSVVYVGICMQEGVTPLILACYGGYLNIVKHLIEQCNAKINHVAHKVNLAR